jgi:alpha-ribazole phosphatase
VKLILVRHGETTGQSSLRYWGRTDVPLSEVGLEQAQRLGECLKAERFTAIFVSRLKRVQATAEAINRHHNLPLTTCPELDEVDFGQLEGLTAAEIDARFPDFYRLWLNWETTLEFPGGESVAGFHGRVSHFSERLETFGEAQTALVVAHAGTLRMLICSMLDLPLPNWRKMRLDLASRSVVELTPAGGVLVCLNDTSHLARSA